jgi:alanine racemase
LTAPPPRPTWVEISRSALINNVQQLRALAAGCKFMAVDKANAYGHGAALTAPVLAEAGVDWFAVATLAEALELRDTGIRLPILVLGYTPGHQAAEAAQRQITLALYDDETAAAMNRATAAAGTPLAVHIKVNTGMNRLGLQPEEVVGFLNRLRSRTWLAAEGIFTHFATSDMADKRYAVEQYARFVHTLAVAERAGLRPRLAHAANTAALLTMPETHLDLVRSGIALYGLAPDMDDTPLPAGFRPALRWFTSVAHLLALAPGEPVSYGGEWVAQRPTVAAVLPVGYADGFPRRPFNWGSVLVRGKAAPILGRVCMDQTVIDVTDVIAATGPLRRDEPVVLIGPSGDQTLTAEALSVRVGTNNYDLVCRIAARVPRLLVA